ncbi:MAG TPA: DinB family protein, partial [Fimbriimonadaceae bacterium]|nr:DinB family protein [Fimbriimonadaceae bacterium]
MDPKTVSETFRQIIAGDDIPAPEGMLRTISAKYVTKRLPGFPYTILENLWHAVFWQNIWLNKIEGKKVRSFMEDWQSPDPSEFPALRKEFVANLEKARKIAGARAF